MPTLNLKISPLQNPQRYAALGAALTRITHDVLHKNPQVTVLMIDDLPAARFMVAGRDAALPVACLEIDITAGTNTADEKAQFIQEAYAELQRQLSTGQIGLNPASYVIVRELPGSDWGYGGVTQAARRAAIGAVPSSAKATL
jgi:4-oxalocrotonate tautomerase